MRSKIHFFTHINAALFLVILSVFILNMAPGFSENDEGTNIDTKFLTNDGTISVSGKLISIEYSQGMGAQSVNKTVSARTGSSSAGGGEVTELKPLEAGQYQACQLVFGETDTQACARLANTCSSNGVSAVPAVRNNQFLTLSCPPPTEPPAEPPVVTAEGEPVEIYLTQAELETLNIKIPTAHIGPPAGYAPAGANIVAWTDSNEQIIETTILNTPVTVRVVPVSYEWHFGDGTILTSSFPGRQWPAKDISMRYKYEGWYETFLITTFAGEFSVDGGEFQPIIGTVNRRSEGGWIYSDVLTARLVGGTPGELDPELFEIPERSAETMGAVNEEAEVTRLKNPRSDAWWRRQEAR